MISNIVIPELLPTDAEKVELIFTLKNNQQQSIAYHWSHHWLSPGGEKILSYCRQDSDNWLRFPSLADFRISTDAKEVECFPLPRIPVKTLRHLLLDQVLPRCLAHQGKIMVHASAVQLERGLLLFIGISGAGKSTLAGNFHQAGNPVVSDDCLWIKEDKVRITAVPSYGGLRLWEDSFQALFSTEQGTSSMAHYSAKKRVPLNQNDLLRFNRSIPVLSMVVISPPAQNSSSKVSLERLSQRDAFITLLKQTFHLDVTDLDRMIRYVKVLGSIVPKLPAYHLSMPRDYELLPLVRQKILETVL